MDVLRIRRLCLLAIGFAFALPLVPLAMGAVPMGGSHYGNAPLYGEAECMGFSLAFLLLAAVGAGLTQAALPRRLRRLTLPKMVATGVLYVVAVSVFVVQ